MAEGPEAFDRLMKLWVSREDFGAINWGARTAHTTIDDFMRIAIKNAVRAAAKDAAAAGKPIPPGIAKWLER